MKAILKSFKPNTVANTLNGDTTLFVNRDVRLYKATMKLIEEQGYATFFMYCTKDKKSFLYWDWYDPPYVEEEWFVSTNPKIWSDDRVNINGPFNGKIVAKLTIRKVEEINCEAILEDFTEKELVVSFQTETINRFSKKSLEELSCLTSKELSNYLSKRKYNTTNISETCGYAYHIEDLVVFDKPKELSEFNHIRQAKDWDCFMCDIYQSGYDCFKQRCLFPLTKAPQNFCYVESEE